MVEEQYQFFNLVHVVFERTLGLTENRAGSSVIYCLVINSHARANLGGTCSEMRLKL